MAINFRWPQFLKSIRFGSTLAWGEFSDQEIIKTLTGSLPLLLSNTIKQPIKSLIQYGKCEQNGTPTPSSPIDIMCNNGAIRMVHRSGLPSGYKLLEYVGGSGSQYVITDLYLASTDVVECEFRNSAVTGYGAVYGVFKLGESSALYGNQTYYGYDVSNDKVNTRINVDTEWHTSRHDFMNGTLTIDDTTVTFTPFEFVNSTKNAVLSRYYNNSYGYNWKGYIRKFKVTRNGEVVCNLLPAKDSNDVAGLYDLISGNFYTAIGDDLLEGDVVDDCEFAIVGTPEVLSVTATGATPQTASVQTLYAVGDYADTQNIISGAVTRRVRVKVLDGTEDWTWSSTRVALNIEDAKVEDNTWTIICSHYDGYLCSTSLDYVPDNGCKYNVVDMNFLIKDSVHGTSAVDFKAYLAAQYAAGTPVIILYPLAEKTTNTVTRQVLKTEEGTTSISAIAEIAPIDVEIKYGALDE